MLHPITQMTWPRTIASSTRALDRPFLRGLSPLRDDRLRFVLRAIALPTMAAFLANGRSTATASSCETLGISASPTGVENRWRRDAAPTPFRYQPGPRRSGRGLRRLSRGLGN